uniref:Tetratricopeptide repeat domain-containing protein n=1 Tax=uncultured marine group II/III euryarchaeote KM3_176_D09 TaxID=1457935 RepID=A0A075GNS9_9EURY|nr:tetratricopeptide repeat domain-containing protein [uncultured marine group II/III euryarchaeote KM3_176_D09]
MARLALVSDDLHFLQHLLPEWERQFDLRVLNPPKPPPRIRGPRDLLAGLRNRRLRSRELAPLAEWGNVIFCEWATHYLEWLSHHPGRAKLATRMHRYELERHGNRVNWDNVALVLFLSDAMERAFRAAVPGFGGRTAVVYENIDFAKFTTRERGATHRLGMLGQVIPRKGVREAVEFFATVADELPALSLSIAGKAPDARYRREVEQAIAAAGLDGRVTLEGFVPDLQAWYHSLDLIVSNSQAEGLQTSLVEGVASGCCALSRDWAGAEEVVPPEGLFSSATEFRQRLVEHYALDAEERTRQATGEREALLERLTARPRMAELLAGLAP